MKYIILLSAVLTIAAAIPVEIAEDEDGQEYYLLPVSREKRQTTWDVSNSGVSLGHKGTIFDNNRHTLDGSAYALKNFDSHGLRPDQVGGRLDYAHKPSGSTAFVGADHARGYGTDVNAGVNYNIYHRKNLDVGLTGSYGRHFGGPFGTGRPNTFVGIGAQGRF